MVAPQKREKRKIARKEVECFKGRTVRLQKPPEGFTGRTFEQGASPGGKKGGLQKHDAARQERRGPCRDVLPYKRKINPALKKGGGPPGGQGKEGKKRPALQRGSQPPPLQEKAWGKEKNLWWGRERGWARALGERHK